MDYFNYCLLFVFEVRRKSVKKKWGIQKNVFHPIEDLSIGCVSGFQCWVFTFGLEFNKVIFKYECVIHWTNDTKHRNSWKNKWLCGPQWITHWCLKQKVLGLSVCMNMNTRIQVNLIDKSEKEKIRILDPTVSHK